MLDLSLVLFELWELTLAKFAEALQDRTTDYVAISEYGGWLEAEFPNCKLLQRDGCVFDLVKISERIDKDWPTPLLDPKIDSVNPARIMLTVEPVESPVFSRNC